MNNDDIKPKKQQQNSRVSINTYKQKKNSQLSGDDRLFQQMMDNLETT